MTKLINDWDPEVRSLLVALIAAGFIITKTDNGEDVVKRPDLETAIKELTATDEGHLYIKRPLDDRGLWLFLALGNSPGELVADWGCPRKESSSAISYQSYETMEAVLDLHSEEWEGKPQPMIEESVRYGK